MNKKILWLLICLLLFSPSFSLAISWVDLPTNIAVALIASVLLVGILISQFFAYVAGAILDWVSSPSFISLSYTKPCPSLTAQQVQQPQPGCNPIITMGLDIIQPFVNMILVIILVYVALAIALRLGEIEAKRAFVRLILIALLVNFAPVVAGLIIDAANITMNYFLDLVHGRTSIIPSQLGEFSRVVGDKLHEERGGLLDILEVAGMGTVQIILNLAMALIFYCFAFIFMVRYIIIWIMVILAPIAFACWILPQARRVWNMWWNQFIAWAIIGIPLAFFLYLALASFSAITQYFTEIESPGIEHETLTMLDHLFPYGVVLIFLLLGMIFSLIGSAQGATAVISFAKTRGRKALRWSGRTFERGMRRLTKGRSSEFLKKQATARMPGWKEFRGVTGKAAAVLGYGSGLIPAFWALRRGLGAAGLAASEAEMRDIKKAQEELKGATPERLLSAIRTPGIAATTPIASLITAKEEGKIGDLRARGLSDDEIIKVGQAALGIDPEVFKPIRDAFPHLAEKMGQGFSEETQRRAKVSLAEALDRGYASVMERLMDEMGTNQIPTMDSSILFGPGALPAAKAAMHKFWGREKVLVAGRSFGPDFCREFYRDYITKITQQPDWYDRNNPRLSPTILRTSPAFQGLFGRIR